MVYPWLEQHRRQLSGYLEQQRIPQALLIHGSGGLGKLHLAESFARSLLCERPAADRSGCGACRGCRLFAAGNHPDYLFLEPEAAGKAITIDSIRGLLEKLTLKPQYPIQRCVVIRPADALNNAAANAFLKCLEEPAERTTIVLISEKPARLPATIRSRCQLLAISRPSAEVALGWLASEGVEDARRCLSLANGSPLLARTYAAEGLPDRYDEYFDDWLQIAQGHIHAVQLAERWIKREDEIGLDKAITWMLHWLESAVKCVHHHNAENEANNVLQELSERLDLKQLHQFYRRLLSDLRSLDTPVNRQLMLESILIEWSRLNKR